MPRQLTYFSARARSWHHQSPDVSYSTPVEERENSLVRGNYICHGCWLILRFIAPVQYGLISWLYLGKCGSVGGVLGLTCMSCFWGQIAIYAITLHYLMVLLTCSTEAERSVFAEMGCITETSWLWSMYLCIEVQLLAQSHCENSRQALTAYVYEKQWRSSTHVTGAEVCYMCNGTG